MITVSIVNKDLSAICIAKDGTIVDKVCLNTNISNSDEKCLNVCIIALKRLKQYIEKEHIQKEVVYFEGAIMDVLDWLSPTHNTSIPTNLIPLYEELNTIRETLPVVYNFTISNNSLALKYLDEKYIEKQKLSGVDSLL